MPAMAAGSPARAVEVTDVDSVVDAAAKMAESVLAECTVKLGELVEIPAGDVGPSLAIEVEGKAKHRSSLHL